MSRRLARPRVVAALLLALATGQSVSAATWWAKTRITGVAAVSEDPEHAEYKDTIWIGFVDESWLPPQCRGLPGALFRVSDTALFALATQALDRGDPVTVKVDDAGRIGSYCRVFQITRYTNMRR